MADQAEQRTHVIGLRWVTHVLAWAIILTVTVVLFASVLVPRVSGATPYTILTGSMRPDLPPGSLAVVKPVAVDQIRVGSVITYQLESGRRLVVTHRVVSVGYTVAGEPVFRTQGDANNAVDEREVRPVQIRGSLWYRLPVVGYAGTLIGGEQRRVATILVAVGLLVYASWLFATAARDRRTRRMVGGPT